MTEHTENELRAAAAAYLGYRRMSRVEDARGAFWQGDCDTLFPADARALAAVRHDGDWEEVRACLDAARGGTPLSREDALRRLLTEGSRGSEWEEAGLLDAVSAVFFSEEEGFLVPALERMLESARNN